MFHVRHVWLGAVIDEMQKATGRLALIDRIDAHAFMKTFAHTLSPPQNAAERHILRGLLQQFAGEVGIVLHAHVHESARGKPCSFVPCLLLEPFWKARTMNPTAVFQVWVDAFFTRFDQVHPISAATRAAHLVRWRYEQAWNASTLSKHLHTTASRLTNEFRREYGMSPRDYLRVVRLVMALDRVRHEKVEAIALDLGYRSRKNFARAFKKVTGLTSTEFRERPLEQTQRIVDAAQMMLSAPRSTARMRQAWSSHAPRISRALAADMSRA